MKPRLETSQGAPLPHQMAGNPRNGNPLRLVSPRSRKGGYGKISADPTAANTGLLLPYFFVLLFPTRMPLKFSRPISHGANQLHTVPPPLHFWTRRPHGIYIGTLNIQDGRGFGMAQAIQAVERGFFDLMPLTDAKIQSDAYSHNRIGYNMTCLTACPSRSRGAQGDNRLLTREIPVRWGIDSTQYHIPNVVSYEIVDGITWTPLVGAYLPTSTLEHLSYLEEALHRFR